MPCCASECEAVLAELGFTHGRVLTEGASARIEVAPGELGRLADPEISDAIHERFRRLGFFYVSVDLGDAPGEGPDEGGLVAGLPPESDDLP
jgi:PP-loop superfamily ATP-utilizing enzyme